MGETWCIFLCQGEIVLRRDALSTVKSIVLLALWERHFVLGMESIL
jgi:hypothetical protein